MDITLNKKEVEMKWEMKNLGDLIEILSGFAFDSKCFNENIGTPLIRIRDIKRSFSNTFYNGSFDERYIITKGDVLIGMDGEFNIAEWKGDDALLNQRVCKVSVKDNSKLLIRYLLYFLPFQLKLIEDKASFVTVKHLSVNDIKNIQIPLPPLPIQKRIADILDAADALRRKDQELVKKYDELAQAIFIDMFGDPVRNEKGWEVVLLKDIVHSDRIITYGIVQAGENIPNGIPYIKTGDIKDGEILIEQLQRTSEDVAKAYQRSQLFENDIIMSIRATVGTVALLPNSLVGANLTQGTARISPSNKICRMYLYYFLKNDYAQNWIGSQAKGATFREITLGKLRELPVFLPQLSLQLRFEKVIKNIIDGKQKIKVQSVNSNDLFNALLQKAFKGEL